MSKLKIALSILFLSLFLFHCEQEDKDTSNNNDSEPNEGVTDSPHIGDTDFNQEQLPQKTLPSPTDKKRIVIIVSGGGPASFSSQNDFTHNFPRFYQFGLGLWYTSIYKFNYNPDNVYFAYTDGTDSSPDSYNISNGQQYYFSFEVPKMDISQELISDFTTALSTWKTPGAVDTQWVKRLYDIYDEAISTSFDEGVLQRRNYSSNVFSYNNVTHKSSIPIVKYKSDLVDLNTIFDSVLAKVSQNDGYTVYFYLLGHGLESRPAVRVLSSSLGGFLDSAYLTQKFEKIGQHAKVLANISSCYSGLFLSLSDIENVAITTSTTGKSIAMFKSGVAQEGMVDKLNLTKDYLADIIDHTMVNFLDEYKGDSPLITSPIDTYLEHYLTTHYRAIENITWNTLDYLVLKQRQKQKDQNLFSQLYIANPFAVTKEKETIYSSFSRDKLAAQITEKITLYTENDDSLSLKRKEVLDYIQGELAFIIDANDVDVFRDVPAEDYLDLMRFYYNQEILDRIKGSLSASSSCKKEIEANSTAHLGVMRKCLSTLINMSSVSSLERSKFSEHLTYLTWSSLIRLGNAYDIVRLFNYYSFATEATLEEIETFLKKKELMNTSF